MIRRGWSCWVLALVGGLLSLNGADRLDQLSRAVDELENHFWRGYLNPPGNIYRTRCQADVDRVNQLAREVQSLRKQPQIPGVVNPTVPAMVFADLLRESRADLPYKQVPKVPRTCDAAFRKEFLRNHRVRKNEKLPPVGRDEYQDWLMAQNDAGLEAVRRKFKVGANLSLLQSERLLNAGIRYGEALVRLRLAIFDLRHQDPYFILPETPAESLSAQR